MIKRLVFCLIAIICMLFTACGDSVPEELDSYEDICWEDNIYDYVNCNEHKNYHMSTNTLHIQRLTIICIVEKHGENYIFLIEFTQKKPPEQ